ncbi:unnamed protein product [Staurois parvus]|uniref:Uncharacterized protein n=1 Tax=Staurois parvus TaxID=386267 RepID=A0ABN9HLB2_9NEOB|nr:unnamed protein product [Staurois parvus]
MSCQSAPGRLYYMNNATKEFSFMVKHQPVTKMGNVDA